MSLSINDLKTGKIYTVDFSGVHNARKIDASNATDKFRTRYPTWRSISAKRVLILDKVEKVEAHRTVHCAKFAVLPINRSEQNKLTDDGEWCLSSSGYFRKCTNPPPVTVCSCDIWITGCKCGAFKTEQTKKKS